MKVVENLKSLNVVAMTAASATLFAGSCALAQSEDAAEEIAPIVIDNRYGGDESIAAEDEFEDLVFDEEQGSYRLIEDDAEDDWVEPIPQGEQDLNELKRLFELYREALINNDFLEADVLAKRVVELSIHINGLDSHDSAKAITNLGIAQHHNKDYESALLNFTASIDIIERIDNRLSGALVNPLQGLAATQAAVGRPDQARQTYQRAVHVSQVNDGPHNAKQVTTLESMAELYLSMGELKDATNIQENIFSIQSRKIDPQSMDIIPALKKRAEWQHRLQHYAGERSTWRQVIKVIERHQGKNSLELLPPLKNLGKSYLFVSPAEYEYHADASVSSGETHLRRANRIAQANPDSDWRIIEDTLLAIGDYYVLSGRPNRAFKIYAEAWNVLTEGNDQERLNVRREHLEKQVVLQQVYPPRYYNSLREDTGQQPPTNFETGTISFSFLVLPSGRIADVKHIETQPAGTGKFRQLVERRLRRLIYRPRIVDGKMVATANVIYTHEFFYRPSDLDTDDTSDVGAGGTADSTEAQPATEEATQR